MYMILPWNQSTKENPKMRGLCIWPKSVHQGPIQKDMSVLITCYTKKHAPAVWYTKRNYYGIATSQKPGKQSSMIFGDFGVIWSISYTKADERWIFLCALVVDGTPATRQLRQRKRACARAPETILFRTCISGIALEHLKTTCEIRPPRTCSQNPFPVLRGDVLFGGDVLGTQLKRFFGVEEHTPCWFVRSCIFPRRKKKPSMFTVCVCCFSKN